MRPTHRLTQIAAILLLAFVSAQKSAEAQSQTTVSFDSGSQYLNSDSSLSLATRLSAGNASTLGDGAVLRLGYYSNATTSNFFSGTFIPLTGALSANTAYTYTSIGDDPKNGAGDNGTFALILSFASGSSTSGNNLPAVGTPLSIQFYDGTTLANSTRYNAVADAAWLWQAPAVPGPTVTISLDQGGLTWLGGASTAFYTSQAVPEPSTLALGLVVLGGLVCLALQRKRIYSA